MGTRDPLGVLAPLPPAPAVPGGFSHFTDGDGAQSWPQRFKSSRRGDENSGLRSTACPARGSPSASGRLRGATREPGHASPGFPGCPAPDLSAPRSGRRSRGGGERSSGCGHQARPAAHLRACCSGSDFPQRSGSTSSGCLLRKKPLTLAFNWLPRMSYDRSYSRPKDLAPAHCCISRSSPRGFRSEVALPSTHPPRSGQDSTTYKFHSSPLPLPNETLNEESTCLM